MALCLAVSVNALDQQYDKDVVRHVDGLVKAMEYEFSKAVDNKFDQSDSSDKTKAEKKTIGSSKHFMYGGMYGGYGGYGGMYGGMGMYPYYGYGGYYGGFDGNPWTMWKRSLESNPNERVKKAIKAELNDHVLKPFRNDALKIVQEEVNAFNGKPSLSKRNGENAESRFVIPEGSVAKSVGSRGKVSVPSGSAGRPSWTIGKSLTNLKNKLASNWEDKATAGKSIFYNYGLNWKVFGGFTILGIGFFFIKLLMGKKPQQIEEYEEYEEE